MITNRSNPETVHFIGEPDGRGTYGLIISCLFTLVLCVWSALHLNVPGSRDSSSTSLRRNVLWILAGIYAPELVVFTAWRQWSSARILEGVVKEHAYSKDETRRNQWTMTHSFFACTGGFAFDVAEFKKVPEACFLPRNAPDKLTITARGVAMLARCNLLPDIPLEDIEDKSKANHLAKSLVMLQATWMLLQVMGRVAAKLPVTLLELNTVAHV